MNAARDNWHKSAEYETREMPIMAADQKQQQDGRGASVFIYFKNWKAENVPQKKSCQATLSLATN